MGCTLLQSLTLECKLSSKKKASGFAQSGRRIIFIRVYSRQLRGPKKLFLTGFQRISYFSCVLRRNFSQERGFGQEFLRDRNSCIYSEFQLTERQYFVIYREGVEINYFLPYFIDSAKTLQGQPHPTPCEEAPRGAVCSSIKTMLLERETAPSWQG